MTFRSSTLVPLAITAALFAPPGNTSQARPPDEEHASSRPTVTDCLGRTQVQLCLMQVSIMRGYSRIPADAPER
jgi:hypothetical protein